VQQVIIGVDPHKLSATPTGATSGWHTQEVVDRDGRQLGSGRFSTDQPGYTAMRRYAAAWPERTWAVEGANGVLAPDASS
jgi:hypothetical protein